jgi:hypothetical protein
MAVNSIWTPNTTIGGAMNVISTGKGGGGGGGVFKLTDMEYASLLSLEQQYTSQTANKTYENIPTSYDAALRLYDKISKIKSKYSNNSGINLLLQISIEALKGAFNSYDLNARAIELGIQNIFLQEIIEAFHTEENLNAAYADITGTLSMTKTFELSPLFMYYIKYYGVPESGVGFDPNKLIIILTALENSGIDPYGGT